MADLELDFSGIEDEKLRQALEYYFENEVDPNDFADFAVNGQLNVTDLFKSNDSFRSGFASWGDLETGKGAAIIAKINAGEPLEGEQIDLLAELDANIEEPDLEAIDAYEAEMQAEEAAAEKAAAEDASAEDASKQSEESVDIDMSDLVMSEDGEPMTREEYAQEQEEKYGVASDNEMDDDYAERINRFMNGPSDSSSEKPLDAADVNITPEDMHKISELVSQQVDGAMRSGAIMAGGSGQGVSNSVESTLGNDLVNAGKSGLNLVGGISAASMGALAMVGDGLKGGVELVGDGIRGSAELVGDGIRGSAEKFRDRQKRLKEARSEAKSLSGTDEMIKQGQLIAALDSEQASGSNVIDIATRMKQTADAKVEEDVRERLESIANNQLEGSAKQILKSMSEIDACLEVNDMETNGISLSSLAERIDNDDKEVAAMASILLRGASVDLEEELIYMSKARSDMDSNVELLVDNALQQGWSSDQIQTDLLAQIDEWRETKEAETEKFNSIVSASIKAEEDNDPEKAKRMQALLESIQESAKNLIAKLRSFIGGGGDKPQASKANGMSR